MLKSINYQLKDINLAIDFILKNITSKTLLFNGAMGSGKTTIIKSLVNAVHYLHSKGICHRDITNDNIIYD